MLATSLLYIGALFVFIQGVLILAQIKNLVPAFSECDVDARRYFSLGWASLGFLLLVVPLGIAFAAFLFRFDSTVNLYTARWAGSLLALIAIWGFVTGFRTKLILLKLFPVFLLISAALIVSSTFLV